jgi:hypothetical protein
MKHTEEYIPAEGETTKAAKPVPRITPKVEVKFVRHNFSDAEKLVFGNDLGQAIAAARAVETEFNTVKASFKLRAEEAKTRIDSLGTKLQAGFEMREARCVVVYDAKARRKFFYLEDAPQDAAPVLDEPMTGDDFQQDLLIAESAFELRDELPIFAPAGNDRGIIVIGRHNGRWYTALRIQVGAKSISERLDSEQPSTKLRADAIRKAARRSKEWIVDNLGKDAFEGFKVGLESIVKDNEEKVEGGGE